jgi:UDP-glucose 4-epimerase
MLIRTWPEPKTPSRAVLLGAGGFLGQALAARLKETGVPLLALGRNDIDLAADGADARLAARLAPDDALVFLSAITPDKDRGRGGFMANMRMGANVCAALEARPVAHVVYVSSDAVYPFSNALIDETTPAEPTDLYGAMHRARELMVQAAAKCPLAILRPVAIYGDGDTHDAYGPNRFARQTEREGKIALFGAGEETRDHLAVEDAAELIRLTLVHRGAGLLNLASGRSATFRALAEAIAKRRSPPAQIVESPRRQPITHRHFDVAARRRAFAGFSPRSPLGSR